MYTIISKYNSIYSDDSWNTINKMMGELNKILPNLNIMGSKYKHTPERVPNGKSWTYVGVIEDSKGKNNVVILDVKAHGAGSVKDPLDKYDITVLVNTLSPNSIKDSNIKSYLMQYGIK
jgi:hypothetical protein